MAGGGVYFFKYHESIDKEKEGIESHLLKAKRKLYYLYIYLETSGKYWHITSPGSLFKEIRYRI